MLRMATPLRIVVSSLLRGCAGRMGTGVLRWEEGGGGSGGGGGVEFFEGGVFALELGDEVFEGADGVFGALAARGVQDDFCLLADAFDGVVDGFGDADFVVRAFGGAFAV